MMYIRHPIKDRYGLDFISAHSSSVVGDSNFYSFVLAAHGFSTIFACVLLVKAFHYVSDVPSLLDHERSGVLVVIKYHS